EVAQLRQRLDQQSTHGGSETSAVLPSDVLERLVKIQGDQMQEFISRQTQEVDNRLERFFDRLSLPSRINPEDQSIIPSERGPPIPKAVTKPPPSLEDGISYRQWNQWLSSWKNYANLVKINGFSRQEQVASFRSFCTPKMLSKMEFSMNIPVDTQDTLDEVINKISTFLKLRHNLALDRFRLLNRRQDENEPFDDFYTSLQELAAEAELRLMSHDDWIAMLVLVGTSDDKVRQELLAKVVPPTLEETIIMCRNEEKGRMGIQGLRSPDGVSVAACKVKTPYQKGKSAERRGNSSLPWDGMEDQLRRERCRDCGFRHMDKDHCPARSGTAKCHRCGKSGHFAPVCHLHKNDAQQEQSCNAIIIAGISTSPNISVCVMATSDR
ncbi:hypothetical protein TCAL_07552, partial [Tigriopus californicus]